MRSKVDDYPADTQEPWIDDDGFLRARTGGVHRTRVATEHTLRIAAALTASGPRPGIWDIRTLTSADPDAWPPFIDQIPSLLSALAMLVSDATSHQAIVFQDAINALLVPCRLFKDVESAVAWLKSLDT